MSKTDTNIVKEDPDQIEKDKIISKIEAADARLEQNLSERDRRDVQKIRRKLIKRLKNYEKLNLLQHSRDE